MINVKDNYKNSEIDTKCELCESEDTLNTCLNAPYSRD